MGPDTFWDTQHLQDAAAALDLHLTEDEIAELERPYTAQDDYWW